MGPTYKTFALAFALTGCAVPAEEPGGAIPASTLLALSPSGKNLVASWPQSSSSRTTRLFTLSGAAVVATRDMALPPDTFTTAFARGDDELLVTTLNGDASELVRVDLQRGDERTSLYRSPAMLRFPLQVEAEHYVFLEANRPGDRFSRWQRLRGGEKSLLSDKNYGLGAPLEHVHGALFQLEPRNPPEFRVFEGRLPDGLQAIVDPATWVVTCSDTRPLICARMHLRYSSSGQTFQTLQIFNGTRRCDVPGQWRELREMRISRDGRTLVFHAAVPGVEAPRAIYAIDNNSGCTPVQIDIRGGK